jgi:hypothetical protein
MPMVNAASGSLLTHAKPRAVRAAHYGFEDTVAF